MLGDLNARVGNEVIEGIVDTMECQEEMKVEKRLLEMCAEQELVVVTVGSRKMMCINTHG